jgi:hypothetical protein
MFGIDSDILGFADTDRKISIHGVTNPVREAEEAAAEDSYSDVVALTQFDTASGHQATVNYVLAKDTVVSFYDTAAARDFRLGKVINGWCIISINGATSNKSASTVSFGVIKTNAVDSEVSKYQPGFTLNGGRKARGIGAQPDSVSRLTGSSVSATVQQDRTPDSEGNELALDVFGGRVEATHNLVGVTGDPGASTETGWTQGNGPSDDEGNTKYADGTFVVFKHLARDS